MKYVFTAVFQNVTACIECITFIFLFSTVFFLIIMLVLLHLPSRK